MSSQGTTEFHLRLPFRPHSESPCVAASISTTVGVWKSSRPRLWHPSAVDYKLYGSGNDLGSVDHRNVPQSNVKLEEVLIGVSLFRVNFLPLLHHPLVGDDIEVTIADFCNIVVDWACLSLAL